MMNEAKERSEYIAELENENIEQIQRPNYLSYLNLLLFCGVVFIFGFIGGFLDGNTKRTVVKVAEPVPATPADQIADTRLTELRGILQTFAMGGPDLLDFKIVDTKNGIDIHFGVSDMFQAGQAEFQDNKREALALLAQTILSYSNYYKFDFIGHTDDATMIKNAWRYPTNWELSTARASAIIRVFIKNGFPDRQITAVGRSGVDPIVPNRDANDEPITENRLKNRRMVLSIHP